LIQYTRKSNFVTPNSLCDFRGVPETQGLPIEWLSWISDLLITETLSTKLFNDLTSHDHVTDESLNCSPAEWLTPLLRVQNP
jgi:hypothetical protein